MGRRTHRTPPSARARVVAAGLSDRQLAILRLAHQRKDARVIQQELGMSSGTFRGHLRMVREKLQLPADATMGDMIREAKTRGIHFG